jgi:cytochrome b pre-mRNA-processing protein 3
MLKRLFRPRPAKDAGVALFKALSAQARTPALYAALGAPDTVEGRFEVYVLHLVVVLHRLKGEGAEAAEVSQATFDAFLKNLDEGLRDMGVGDLSVGKKMRKLGEAVYGRIKSYDTAFAASDVGEALAPVIARTVFEGRADAPDPAPLARYAARAVESLGAQPLDQVLRAEPAWPQPEAADG